MSQNVFIVRMNGHTLYKVVAGTKSDTAESQAEIINRFNPGSPDGIEVKKAIKCGSRAPADVVELVYKHIADSKTKVTANGWIQISADALSKFVNEVVRGGAAKTTASASGTTSSDTSNK